MTNPQLQQAYDRVMVLKQVIDKEGMVRAEIIYGDKYLALQRKITALQTQADCMLDGLEDSSATFAAAKHVLLQTMEQWKTTHHGEVFLKFKTKKEVNIRKVAQVLEGDLALLFAIAKVTQKDLKEHAKGNASFNELMACIEEYEVVDDLEFAEQKKTREADAFPDSL